MRTQLSATPTQTAQTTTCHSTYTSHGDRKRQQLSSSYFRFAHTKNRNWTAPLRTIPWKSFQLLRFRLLNCLALLLACYKTSCKGSCTCRSNISTDRRSETPWSLTGLHTTNPDLSYDVFFTKHWVNQESLEDTTTDETLRDLDLTHSWTLSSWLATELENTGRLENQTVFKADNLQAPHQRNTHSIHVG